jgi:predicted TIM-barrel fold metal-dependent hydrolase
VSDVVRRIDAHVHVTTPAFLAELRRRSEGRPLGAVPSTLDELLEMMGRYEVDAAVVSGGPPGVFFGDQGAANELARAVNEELAELVRAEPARIAALAYLPLPDVDAALAELSHALDLLHLDGVFLPSNVAGTYLGDPRFDPLFAELERRRAYVFLHPAFPPSPPPLLHHPVWLYEFPFETTRAVVELVYSGTLERCPNVRIQLAHLGGTAPFLAHRIASLADREPALAERAPAGALEYLRRLYYDTGLSNNAVALASTLEVAPLNHVIFGSDWPYAALPQEGSDPAPGLGGLTADGRAGVDAANAAALVPRLAAV